MLQDLKYALRLISKSRGFAFAAIAVLAVSIGANSLIFGIINVVLLQSLPYHKAESLVWVWENNQKRGFSEFGAAPAKLQDWRQQNSTLSGLAAIRDQSFDLEGSESPERLLGIRTSASLFSVLGANPVIGRIFLQDEEKMGAQPVVVLSHGLWVRRFNADSHIIDKQIDLDGQNYTVIGVMGPNFWFPSREYQLWVPLRLAQADVSERAAHTLRVVARLKPGV